MQPVTTLIEGDLIINSVEAHATVATITAYVEENIGSWSGKLMIWRIGAFDFSGMNHKAIQEFSRAMEALSRQRAGDRTAFVAESDLTYGIARVFLAYTESADTLVHRRVFRTMTEARAWLLAD